MASVTPISSTQREQDAWNDAYLRVTDFLSSFALGDRAHVSRLALDFVGQARVRCAADPSLNPTTLTMDIAQKALTDWLATNLDRQGRPASEIVADGSIAVLLSRIFRTAPTTFINGPLPEELRQALRESLVVTGPDLNVSSMTPRHLDFGPMLQFARQTWHRWDAKELVIAVLFWTGVYFLFYWCLADL